jgi:uncharacterized protein
MISQTCNLRCSYCYGDKGKFGSEGACMTKEVAEKAIRFLVEKSKIINSQYFLITFFGGEPLLNFELIKFVIEFNKTEYPDKEFTYTFTTNGTLFTHEIIDYIKSNNVSILISIDGDKKIHDSSRVFEDGKGSFIL